jgi:hypothetical protein
MNTIEDYKLLDRNSSRFTKVKALMPWFVVDGVVLLSWTIQLSIERNFCAVDSALIMGNTVI